MAPAATVGLAVLVEVQVPVEPMETVETEVAPGLVEPAVAAARQRRLVAVRPVATAVLVEPKALLARGELPAWELDQQDPLEPSELRRMVVQAAQAETLTALARELSLQLAAPAERAVSVHSVVPVAPVVTPT